MIDASKLPTVPREVAQARLAQRTAGVAAGAERVNEDAIRLAEAASVPYPSRSLVLENGQYHVAKPQE